MDILRTPADFFARQEYSLRSFSREPGYKRKAKIALVGSAGTGTSTLASAIEQEFIGYKKVSGGDYQRYLADKIGITVEKLAEQNAANPSAGTDKDTETFLVTFGQEHEHVVMDARIAPAILFGEAFTILLYCDDVEECARRGLPRMRKKHMRPEMTLREAIAETENRNERDLRLGSIYPGSLWPKKDFFLQVNTLRHDEKSTLDIVIKGYRVWCQQNGLEFPLLRSAQHAEGALAVA